MFTLVNEPGEPQYELELRAIRRLDVPEADAKAAYALHSRDGARIARQASDQVETQQVRAYHYRPDDGVLVRAKAPRARTATADDALRRYEFLPGEVDVHRSRLAGRAAR